MTEERIGELKDRAILITQQEQERKNGPKNKIKRTSRICKSVRRDLTFMLLESQKVYGKKMWLKNYSEKQWLKNFQVG